MTEAPKMWPDQRIVELFGIEVPIIQAPMAGSTGSEMVLAVAAAGGLGSLPCALRAVKVPVIAAGGIADARGIVAAFALEAAAVQIGTAYLFCPEAKISAAYRAALRKAKDNQTALTNVFTGRPARGIVNRVIREVGPMAEGAPEFPLAAGAMAPLRAKCATTGSNDFTAYWAGQAAQLGRELPAGELTQQLAMETLERLGAL